MARLTLLTAWKCTKCRYLVLEGGHWMHVNPDTRAGCRNSGPRVRHDVPASKRDRSQPGYVYLLDDGWELHPFFIVTTDEYYALVRACGGVTGRPGWDPLR